jgi:LPS-assembly lipoprotein
MWWHEHRAKSGRSKSGRFARYALAMAAAGLAGGCFQPLYGDRSLSGGPGVRERLSAVEVIPISVPSGSLEARIAVEIRNALMFDLTGGGSASAPTHRLKITIASLRQQVIVDITTSRPDVEQTGINASYTLTEIATGKSVVTGQTFSRVSYDNPGQQQRFARARGQRDAESRAAKVITDNIKSRLASYFIAGT